MIHGPCNNCGNYAQLSRVYVPYFQTDIHLCEGCQGKVNYDIEMAFYIAQKVRNENDYYDSQGL